MMPDTHLLAYINIYTIIGGVTALTFLLIYSLKPIAVAVKMIGISLALSYLILIFFIDGFWISVIIYPVFLVYNDYIVTQSNITSARNFYRIFLVISVAPFLLYEDHFEFLFELRVILLTFIVIYYAINTENLTALKIDSTGKYVFVNYISYYIPLLIIANVQMEANELKLWYVFSQAGLVLYLRYLDFSSRNGYFVSSLLEKFVLTSAIFAPILPSIIFPSAVGLIAFYLGLLGLIYSKRYIKFDLL